LVTDVLAIYANEIVPEQARPEKAAQRIVQLGEWWAGKTLDDISGRSCRAYRDYRTGMPRKSAKPDKTGNPPRMVTDAGVRRELEDLRAALNYYHRREGYCREICEVWLPPRGKKRERWLRRSEVAALLRVMWRKQVQVHGRGRRKGEAVPTRKRPWRHLARWLQLAIYTGSRAGVVGAASFKAGEGRAFIDLTTGVFHRLPEIRRRARRSCGPRPPSPTGSSLTSGGGTGSARRIGSSRTPASRCGGE
jgi:hypothetical protein